MYVRPKKKLGQHFLTDESIAERIANSLSAEGYRNVLEIGPGTGMLTKYLLARKDIDLSVIELDRESVAYLRVNFPELKGHILEGDFLRNNIQDLMKPPMAIIGNFPYNISSQILFKAFENRDLVPEVVGMFQKEVAERVASKPGNKTYGILSVLLQAVYDTEYLFTVPETVFRPPPKVKSGVISLKRKADFSLPVEERHFKAVVKTAFNQRRKTLRNALKPLGKLPDIKNDTLSLRAEQLHFEEFITLTKWLLEHEVFGDQKPR